MDPTETTNVFCMAIDEDLALCIVLDITDPRAVEGLGAWAKAHKALLHLLGWMGTSSPIPPAPGSGGQGATAIAGAALYLPRKVPGSN
jgi:hypothetical protein